MHRTFVITGALPAILLAAMVIIPQASGAVYYVDSMSGSDSQNGLSASAPWRTLSHVASAPILPGDLVLLKRGSVWGEPLIPSASGLPDVPITFAAYGAGPRPLIDGSSINGHSDVIVTGKTDLTISGIELRNSALNGLSITASSRILLRDLAVSANSQSGILMFDCNSIVIENSEISGNALDTSASYDGIRIDGSGGELSSFVIRNCYIHDNIGGDGWNSGNGIYLGHTGTTLAILRGVVISGNEIAFNGNPNQNQAGRGLTGTFTGDIQVLNNYVHHSASAGIYLGDEGVKVDITLVHNVFYNNSLRQFGGYTDTTALAYQNTIFVDDATLTAMGAEVGGAGTWDITNNVFYYETGTTDTYRGFIRLNDSTQDQNLQSDWNLFYSAGPNRWKMSNGLFLDFPHWRTAGFDPSSKNPQ